ncbi:hypothetical protein RFI_19559 [Reticulomyxa filosa]|uniref:Anoctamin transmembrane domain-containing protein n=1 Tax=Reticulomyxa filosa TaxID=46433 RepID=X6MUT4_RETFI|nr:hypothetical protein RFI_19559 [Reticulomyxa filosa]|eukprot:ETO17758.1 hypothetical protein RFI_19559 [Reticulomyxa filosa]
MSANIPALPKDFEYVLFLNENFVNEKLINNLKLRISACSGLEVEYYNELAQHKVHFLTIRMTKNWIVKYIEAHMDTLDEILDVTSLEPTLSSFQKKKEKAGQEDLVQWYNRFPNKEAILSASVRNHIIYHALVEIKIDKDFVELVKQETKSDNTKQALVKNIENESEEEKSLILNCLHLDWIEQLLPVYCNETTDRKTFWKHWHRLFVFVKDQTLDTIRDYYGEEVGYYFAFMDHYIKWLIIPALSGIFLYATGPTNFNIDHGLFLFCLVK